MGSCAYNLYGRKRHKFPCKDITRLGDAPACLLPWTRHKFPCKDRNRLGDAPQSGHETNCLSQLKRCKANSSLIRMGDILSFDLYWYQTDARKDLDHLKLHFCEFQKFGVITMSVVGSQPNKPAYISYKTTKHIECTFLVVNINMLELRLK